MVDHFGNLRFFDAIDRLRVFIVIDQREPDARRIDEVGFRKHTNHLATTVFGHRE